MSCPRRSVDASTGDIEGGFDSLHSPGLGLRCSTLSNGNDVWTPLSTGARVALLLVTFVCVSAGISILFQTELLATRGKSRFRSWTGRTLLEQMSL